MKFSFKSLPTILIVVSVACLAPDLLAARHAAAPHTNVLLITMDTLRADHIGCYGDKQVRTPAIDSLARDGIRYANAFSQVPLTWPSHTAILTGTYPFQNGVQDFTGQPLAPHFETIAQALARHGYRTGAVVSSFVLARSWGLNRGFDFYDDDFPAPEFEQRDVALVERRASDSVDRALAWLKKPSPKPFFLWLHLYDPHSPYDPPQPFAREYKAHPYDGEIAYADSQLARLIAWLKNSRQYDKTLIIFVADHGESLGEHGESEHGFFLYDATIRVPLILKPAGSPRKSALSIAPAVETIDIVPSILGMLHIKDPLQKQLQGEPLPMEASTQAEEHAAYSETLYPFSSFGWSPLHSLETGKYQFIEAPHPELYDLVADPAETHNLYSTDSAVAQEMKRALDDRVAHNPFSNAQSIAGQNPETLEKLRSLGYLAYKAPVSQSAAPTGLPDPKDKISELNAILHAQDALHAGDFAAGEGLLQQVQKNDPDMYLVPFMLGEADLRQSDWAQAKSDFDRALKLNPHFDQAMTGLARAEFQLGNQDDARHWLQQAISENPQNFKAWYELSFIEARQDPAAAQQALEKTLSIQPNFAFARRDLGMLQYLHKKYAAAAENLAQAVAEGVQDPRVYNALGICYHQTGAVEKAIATYREAIKLDSNLAEAHLNLGFAYETLGRRDEAAKEYQLACSLNPAFCRNSQ
jgi:arylsulfatase A-like enzyme/Flp pilus assembly protein TadD